jgi:hypothetical protein
MKNIKVGDLVEPKPQHLGLIGNVTAVLSKHGTRWIFINGCMLPASKYRLLRYS